MEAALAGNTAVLDAETVGGVSLQPCIRHISSVQIRNLSPFPARDSLASALAHHSTAVPTGAGAGSGLASDDSDILLGRRRRRKISSTSVHTLKSIHSDQEAANLYDSVAGVTPVRKRVNSRTSPQTSSGSTSSPPSKRLSQATPAEVRQRQRTTSEASLPEDSESSNLTSSFQTSSSTSASTWYSDTLNSQKQLEDVIWSRLVETFLTINLPQDDSFEGPSARSRSPPNFSDRMQEKKSGPIPKRRNSAIDSQNPGLPSPSSPPQHFRHPPSISTTSTSKARAYTLSSVAPFDALNTRQLPQASASPHRAAFPRSPPLTPPPSNSSSHVPVFISPFHRPSTNPKFDLDPEDATFARRTDLSAGKVLVRLWGRAGRVWGDPAVITGKGKEKEYRESLGDQDGGEWKVLSEWDVNLSAMVPLPPDLADHPWKLPANSIILTLAPSHQPYYLPSSLLGSSPGASRSHSPDYNSDTEISRRHHESRPSFSLNRGRQRKSRRELKSTNLNELVKLVSLQASLSDAQNLLQEVVRSCDDLIEEDLGTALRRESSEREYHIQRLHEQRDLLEDGLKSARDSIVSRKEQLHQRRIRLAEARAFHEDDLLTEFDAGVQLAEEKKRVRALKSRIEPVRTTLLSTLAFVFPIELFSSPDLLYTILGVPLPIPLQGSDPAPPLSLPQVPAVSEDGVATALGYAALLVHLMATYLCQRLVYPVTYVGSRSLVKDPISAMMGPRMFPLYSKGVDTYRFEYAVFLLNKNIEMLMADRNLRALDLRHTLPNLKNLLLTLTSGESTLPNTRSLPSPSVVSITEGLQSPSPYEEAAESEPPPLSLENEDGGASTTPKGPTVKLPEVDDDVESLSLVDSTAKGLNSTGSPGTTAADGTEDASQPSTSSSTAGTSSAASTLRPRLPRIQIQSYLGLAPLSSMWRGRGAASSSGASSSKASEPEDPELQGEPLTSENASMPGPDLTVSAPTTGKEVVNGSEDGSESGEESGEESDDDFDRRTVRGSSVPTTPISERERRPRYGGTAQDSLLDNIKDLKAQVRGKGTNMVSSETEKRPDTIEDRDATVDTAC